MALVKPKVFSLFIFILSLDLCYSSFFFPGNKLNNDVKLENIMELSARFAGKKGIISAAPSGQTLNVDDFGAKGDGTTDDTLVARYINIY